MYICFLTSAGILQPQALQPVLRAKKNKGQGEGFKVCLRAR